MSPLYRALKGRSPGCGGIGASDVLGRTGVLTIDRKRRACLPQKGRISFRGRVTLRSAAIPEGASTCRPSPARPL